MTKHHLYGLPSALMTSLRTLVHLPGLDAWYFSLGASISVAVLQTLTWDRQAYPPSPVTVVGQVFLWKWSIASPAFLDHAGLPGETSSPTRHRGQVLPGSMGLFIVPGYP